MKGLLDIIKRRWMKLRLQPIRVYCFHQVSDMFDESTMYRCDWLQTDEFKKRIMTMQEEGYTFISLPNAYEKMKHDVFRYHKYAVLTADDGWASLHKILPWLNDHQIPITLFLNPAYLDGRHFRERASERYITKNEMIQLQKKYPLLTIGSHGWEHRDATQQTVVEFRKSVQDADEYLRKWSNYIPYFAFTYGRYTKRSIDIVKEHGLIPLLVQGGKNYNNVEHIDRELL